MMVLLALLGCVRTPGPLELRDPRLEDIHRSWLVDAQDEVAIARARIDDARLAKIEGRAHHDALLDRVRAAGVDVGPWQALGRARATLTDRDQRRAVVRLGHAEARLRLVRAEIAMGADLAVYKLQPLRADVARQRERLTKLVREVEQAIAEAEDRADEAWASWRQHVATSGNPSAFWQGERDVDTDAVVDAE